AALNINNDYEKILIKKIFSLQTLCYDISVNYHTHLLALYAHELASLFHHYYAHHKIINSNDQRETASRLVLVQLFIKAIKQVTNLLGITVPERM
ncbi:MAG: DALR anticodon-binding domain-containing protein, partial [Candidatus Babeliales bacterium]